MDSITNGIKCGDVNACAQMIIQYLDKVYSVAFDVLKDKELAEQSAQHTLWSAFNYIKQGADTGELEPWLLWLARNDALAIGVLKREPEREEEFVFEIQNLDEDGETEKKENEAEKTEHESKKAAEQPVKAETAPETVSETALRSSLATRNILIICLCTAVAVMIWVLLGLLMKNGTIPPIDLLYSWFNENLFCLF